MWTLKCDTNKRSYETEETHRHRQQTYGCKVTMGDKKNAGVAMLTSLR